MYHSPLAFLVILSSAGATLFASWKGDTPARTAGVINALNTLILPAARMFLQQHIGETVQLVGDFVSAVALLFLVTRFAYRWLGVTMFLQAAQFSMHAYYLVMERPADLLHAWINNLDTVGISLSIVAGVALAWRRRTVDLREAAEFDALRRHGSSARS